MRVGEKGQPPLEGGRGERDVFKWGRAWRGKPSRENKTWAKNFVFFVFFLGKGVAFFAKWRHAGRPLGAGLGVLHGFGFAKGFGCCRQAFGLGLQHKRVQALAVNAHTCLWLAF